MSLFACICVSIIIVCNHLYTVQWMHIMLHNTTLLALLLLYSVSHFISTLVSFPTVPSSALTFSFLTPPSLTLLPSLIFSLILCCLHITDVHFTYARMYTCFAIDRASIVTKYSNLTVLVSPLSTASCSLEFIPNN